MKKLIQWCNQAFGFTPTEQKVVLFLVFTFVAGLGIRYAKQAWSPTPVFDYAAADSEFVARSRAADSTGVIDPDTTRPDTPVRRTKVGGKVSGLININSASKTQLMKLPGIGEAMAERIIAFRKEHGPFSSVNDLNKVRGIGAKRLKQLSELCKVER